MYGYGCQGIERATGCTGPGAMRGSPESCFHRAFLHGWKGQSRVCSRLSQTDATKL